MLRLGERAVDGRALMGRVTSGRTFVLRIGDAGVYRDEGDV